MDSGKGQEQTWRELFQQKQTKLCIVVDVITNNINHTFQIIRLHCIQMNDKKPKIADFNLQPMVMKETHRGKRLHFINSRNVQFLKSLHHCISRKPFAV